MPNTLDLKCGAERTMKQITMRQTCEAADNLYTVFSVKFLFCTCFSSVCKILKAIKTT